MKEHLKVCASCNGTGLVQGDRHDLYHILRNIPKYIMTCRDKVYAIKHWMDTGEVPCNACDGRGRWVERWG